MPGECDATEEPTFAQSAEQGKKPREITTSVQRFKKKMVSMEEIVCTM